MRIDLTEMDPADKNFQKVMSTQQSIMSSVFSTQARIDEARLRRQNDDKLEAVLKELRAQEKALGITSPHIEGEHRVIEPPPLDEEAEALAALLAD